MAGKRKILLMSDDLRMHSGVATQSKEIVNLVPRGQHTWQDPGNTLNDLKIEALELYVNNIFMNPNDLVICYSSKFLIVL